MKITKQQLKQIIREELEESNFFDNMRAKQKRCKGKPKTGDCAEDRPTKKAWKKITKEEQDLYDIIDEEIEAVLDEKKKACKPTKGKASAKRVDGKCVSYGQKGKAKGGGDRVQPGTSKGDAYCARSYGDMKSHGKDCSGKDRGTPLCLSRQKWDCSGKYSRK